MPEYKLPITQGKTDSLEDWGTTNSCFKNWIVDDQGAVHPRPAVVALSGMAVSSSGQPVIGAYVWRSPVDLQTYVVYVCADRTIKALNIVTLSVSALSRGGFPDTYLDGTGTRAVFTEDTLSLIIAGGGQLQKWTGTGYTQRLDPPFSWTSTTNQPPTAATHVAFLANYLVANDSISPNYGQFRWSNLGDGAHNVWNPLNFNTADASPDRVTGIYSSLQELYVFGERSLQVYGISTDQYLPFATAAALAVGCVAPYSPIQLEDKFAWLDDRRRFVISDGRSFDVISVPIERTLRDLDAVSDCWGFRLLTSFYDVLVWMFPTSDLCVAYDMKKQTWGTWETLTPLGTSTAPRIGSVAFWPPANATYIGDPDAENIFRFDASASTDVGGTAIPCDMILNRNDLGTANLKHTQRITAYVKRGQGWDGGQLEVAVRDDDIGWRQFSELSLGTPGDYMSSVTWYPGGVYRRRQYRVRYSGSAEMAISGITETFDVRSR